MAKNKINKNNTTSKSTLVKTVEVELNENLNLGTTPEITTKKEVITPEKTVSEDELYMDKIMNFFGYSRKKALHYDYFVKNNNRLLNTYKEKQLLEVFKR